MNWWCNILYGMLNLTPSYYWACLLVCTCIIVYVYFEFHMISLQRSGGYLYLRRSVCEHPADPRPNAPSQSEWYGFRFTLFLHCSHQHCKSTFLSQPLLFHYMYYVCFMFFIDRCAGHPSTSSDFSSFSSIRFQVIESFLFFIKFLF